MNTTDLLKKKLQQVADKRAGNQNTYSFKQPVTTIRILPGWRKTTLEDGSPDTTFFHDYGATWVKDFDGKVMAVIADNKITFGGDDSVRNLVSQALANASSDAQRKHFKEMLAKPRVLVNAQVLDDKNVDANVAQVVEFSEAQFTNAIEQAVLAGIGDEFLDLDNGFDLIVSKSGKGLETKYTFTFARKARKVEAAVRDSINDIDAFIRAKFADSERAVNAIKALTQGVDVLQIENRSRDTSYSGGADVIDGDYNAVDEAKTVEMEPVEIETNTITNAEIDSLFD